MKYISELPEEERFDPSDKKDGTFFINYQSWREIYGRIFVAVDFPEEWTAILYRSAWKPECCGGVPKEGTAAAKTRFAKNPQFLFEPTEACELLVSIAQPDGRVWRQPEADQLKCEQHPFKSSHHIMQVYVFDITGAERLETFDPKKRVANMSLSRSREQTLRIKLEKGKRYVLVPTMMAPGGEGKFYLSLYFDLPLYKVDVRRLDDPTDQFEYIKEEYEKAIPFVPEWKTKFIQDCIKGGSVIGAQNHKHRAIGSDGKEISKATEMRNREAAAKKKKAAQKKKK